MASISHHSEPGAGRAAFADADKLQVLFANRLQSDRLQFVALSARLAAAEESPTATFEALNFRAHRLKGAAATFEFRDLARAAGTLERASARAAASHAEHTDPSVWDALIALVEMLGVIHAAAFVAPRTETTPPIE